MSLFPLFADKKPGKCQPACFFIFRFTFCAKNQKPHYNISEILNEFVSEIFHLGAIPTKSLLIYDMGYGGSENID